MKKSNKKIYYHQYINEQIYQKAIGEIDLFTGIKKHYSTVEGMLDAFKDLGYEVCFDYRTNFFFHQRIFYSNKILSIFRRAFKKIFRKFDNWLLNKRLQKKILEFSPRCFYTELNPVVSRKTLNFMRKKNIKSIEWFGVLPFLLKKNSNPIETVACYDAIISSANIYTHFDKFNKPKNFLEVPPAYSSKIFKRMNLKHIYDVVFIGGVSKIHSNRWDILEVLTKQYDNFVFYGYGIKDVPRTYSFLKKYCGDVWSYDCAKVLNQSKIAINLTLNSFHKLSSGVNNRTFEIAGCGTFQLSEYTDNLKKFFVPGEDLETFKNTDEMIEKIEYYLENPKEREQIALNSQRKALEYDYASQAKYIFDNI